MKKSLNILPIIESKNIVLNGDNKFEIDYVYNEDKEIVGKEFKVNVTNEFVIHDPVTGKDLKPIQKIEDFKKYFSNFKFENLSDKMEDTFDEFLWKNVAKHELKHDSKEYTLPTQNLTTFTYDNFDFDNKDTILEDTPTADVENVTGTKFLLKTNYPIKIRLGWERELQTIIDSNSKFQNLACVTMKHSAFKVWNDFGFKINNLGQNGTLRRTLFQVIPSPNYATGKLLEEGSSVSGYLDTHFWLTEEEDGVYFHTQDFFRQVIPDYTAEDFSGGDKISMFIISRLTNRNNKRFRWEKVKGEIEYESSPGDYGSGTWIPMIYKNGEFKDGGFSFQMSGNAIFEPQSDPWIGIGQLCEWPNLPQYDVRMLNNDNQLDPVFRFHSTNFSSIFTNTFKITLIANE